MAEIYIDGKQSTLYVGSGGTLHINGAGGAKLLPQTAVQPSVSTPTGGSVIDVESRAAIASLIAALKGVGILGS